MMSQGDSNVSKSIVSHDERSLHELPEGLQIPLWPNNDDDQNNEHGHDSSDSCSSSAAAHLCAAFRCGTNSADCVSRRLLTWLREQKRLLKTSGDGRRRRCPKELPSPPPEPVNEIRGHVALDPYPSLVRESFTYAGSRDKLGRPHGRGTIYFPNGRRLTGIFSYGVRNGHAVLYDRDGSVMLSGPYENDALEGVVQATCSYDKSVLQVNVHRGVAHGLARKFTSQGVLCWVGHYSNGYPYGVCWKSADGEGWLVGTVNPQGKVSDDDALYLYPGFHYGLWGRWENDVMQEAYFCAIIQGCHFSNQGCPVPKAQTVAAGACCFRYDVSGLTCISRDPVLRDPYEDLLVSCEISSFPSAGHGLFAKQPLPANLVIAFYNGVRLHDYQAFNDWHCNSYKIRLNEKRKQILDIPEHFQDIESYCATLAHKINHSFHPNARFIDFVHPRFGRIIAVKTIQDIDRGKEIFCNYGYSLADCPDWYSQLYRATQLHMNG